MTTGEVAALTGASLRQLQWWDETDVIVPQRIEGRSPTGEVREYSDEQALLISVMLKLRARSVPLYYLTPHVKAISRLLRSGAKWLIYSRQNARITGYSRPSDLLKFAAKQRAGVHVVEV